MKMDINKMRLAQAKYRQPPKKTETPLFRFPSGTEIHAQYDGTNWTVSLNVPGESAAITTQPSIHYAIKKLGQAWFWQREPATPKQVAYLRFLGYEGEEPKTRSQASALIAEFKGKENKPRRP